MSGSVSASAKADLRRVEQTLKSPRYIPFLTGARAARKRFPQRVHGCHEGKLCGWHQGRVDVLAVCVAFVGGTLDTFFVCVPMFHVEPDTDICASLFRHVRWALSKPLQWRGG